MRSIGCRLLLLPVLLCLLLFAAVASAQEEQEERSRFIRFVERQISTPDRQIRLGRIDGALSSDVQIDSITIADREGVWLRIEGAHLIWSRRALLGRRLEIALLEAEEIAILRAPLAAEGASEPFEQPDFELPELPVVLNVDTVRVPRVDIAAGVVSAQGYELSVTGSVTLDDGVLDAGLEIERLDGSGTLDLEAAFSNATQILDLNLSLSEPEDGIVANLLNLEGRPAVSFAIAGTGPLSDFSADIALAADGRATSQRDGGDRAHASWRLPLRRRRRRRAAAAGATALSRAGRRGLAADRRRHPQRGRHAANCRGGAAHGRRRRAVQRGADGPGHPDGAGAAGDARGTRRCAHRPAHRRRSGDSAIGADHCEPCRRDGRLDRAVRVAGPLDADDLGAATRWSRPRAPSPTWPIPRRAD